MKKKYIIHVLAFMCLVLSSAFFTSCDDEGSESSNETQLLSFGPVGVHQGEEIVFIGQNLDKVTAVVFFPSVEVPKSAFTSVSKKEIRLIVPDAVEQGKVILKTSAGDIESKSIFSLEVPVTITSVTASAKPGTDITITGENVNWIEGILFPTGLEVAKADFVSRSATEVVVTVPMEAQTGFLAFATGGTDPLIIESENPLLVTLPEATDLTPASIRHMAELTITGTDLDLVEKIKFTGSGSIMRDDFTDESETMIKVIVPASAKDGKLTLTAFSGVEVQSDDAVTILLPKVTSFTPSATSSHTPGTTLTMTGTDLDLVEKITFPFVDELVTEFVSQSETELKVVIPAGAKGGTLVFTTIHDVLVPVTVPFGDQLTLATVIYDDAVKAPLQFGGGWGGATTDSNNAEQVRMGAKAVKVSFGGGYSGACQFGNWGSGQTVSTASRTYFKFSVYGGTGTNNKQLLINLAGSQSSINIKEGEWYDVEIPLTSFASPASIAEISFQDTNWTGVVYFDHIGLK